MITKNFKKGFSLVELLVVITIIAILSVTAYVALGGQTTKAKNSRRMQDLNTIQSALEIFSAEKGTYPDELDDGTAASDTDLVPKYMPKMAFDPTTNDEYTYGVNSTNKKYQLAATIENDDDNYEAYVVGNSDDDLIGQGGSPAYPTQAGKTFSSSAFVNCSSGTAVTDGENCVPYAL